MFSPFSDCTNLIKKIIDCCASQRCRNARMILFVCVFESQHEHVSRQAKAATRLNQMPMSRLVCQYQRKIPKAQLIKSEVDKDLYRTIGILETGGFS